MNTTFNINRLGLLLKRFFIENKQRELTYWGILILVFTLIHQGDSVKMVLYITGAIFAAKQFKNFAYNPSGMHFLMVPATHTEKLTAGILLSTIYYFGMFLLTYAIGNILGSTILNSLFETSSPISWDLFHAKSQHMMGHQPSGNSEFWPLFVGFVVLQSIFLLGSLYFKRNAVGKTMLSLLVLSIILSFIQVYLLKMNFGSFMDGGNQISMNIVMNTSSLSNNVQLVAKIGTFLLIPFLWIVSYFRLTEKQV